MQRQFTAASLLRFCWPWSDFDEVLNEYFGYDPREKPTTRTLIEEFSSPERGSCPVGPIQNDFNPQTAALRDAVADTNVKAAIAMLKTCPP